LQEAAHGERGNGMGVERSRKERHGHVAVELREPIYTGLCARLAHVAFSQEALHTTGARVDQGHVTGGTQGNAWCGGGGGGGT
jgi:hypothetical protein